MVCTRSTWREEGGGRGEEGGGSEEGGRREEGEKRRLNAQVEEEVNTISEPCCACEEAKYEVEFQVGKSFGWKFNDIFTLITPFI